MDLFAGGISSLVLGLLLGSFSTCIAYRIPEGRPWAFGGGAMRSMCAGCQKPLRPLNLIPILSWLLQNRRCACAKTQISIAYPLIEAGVALACFGIFLIHDFTLASIIMMLTTPFLMAMIVIDLRYTILPDQLNLICAALGVLFVSLKLDFSAPDFALWTIIDHAGGTLIFALMAFLLGWIMKVVLKRDALGMGDVKFFAVAGLWLGLPLMGIFFTLSGIAGVIFGLIWQGFTRANTFPFGPALIVSFYILLAFGGSIHSIFGLI